MKKFNHKGQTSLKSFDDVDETLYHIAELTLDINDTENEMQKEILAVKNKFEPRIDKFSKAVKILEKEVDEFLKKNKKQFDTKRSRELNYGRVGFRTGKNALRLLSKKFNWEFAKEKFLNLFSSKYIETEIKLNKTKILADADKGILTAEQLAAAGCKITRNESSFYELNLEKIKKEEE